MTKAQALDGEVDLGDVVTVAFAADPENPRALPIVVARDVDVVQVLSTLGDLDPTYQILVSVDEDELLVLTTAAARGELTLLEP